MGEVPSVDFTSEQLKFLAHSPTKHACLLAGPGTGKSTTIIEYASRLRQQQFRGLRLLTFTRAATHELAAKLPDVHAQELRPTTIHSFAISLVLKNPGTAEVPAPVRIMADWEWDTLVRPRISRRLKLGRKWRDADDLRREMAAKWESLSDKTIETIDPSTRAQFVSEWQNHRERFGYTELSEIPFLLFSGLKSHPDFDIGSLKLLIVDEHQDLNACDLACLDELRKRGTVIIAVGDDDQSIYGFRKAHPAGIRHFPEQYSALSYPLTVAQRFGKNILR
jgi:DNA helicase-2/ATP-dependent DNA helicase PcrA